MLTDEREASHLLRRQCERPNGEQFGLFLGSLTAVEHARGDHAEEEQQQTNGHSLDAREAGRGWAGDHRDPQVVVRQVTWHVGGEYIGESQQLVVATHRDCSVNLWRVGVCVKNDCKLVHNTSGLLMNKLIH